MDRVAAWLRDLANYIVALLRHWKAFLTGSTATAVLFLLLGGIEDFKVKTRPFLVIFVVVGILAASFEAWREVFVLARMRAIRADLANLLEAGEKLKDRARSLHAVGSTTDAEADAWHVEVQRYLRAKQPALDPSFLVRFQRPQMANRWGGKSDLWNNLNAYTDELRRLIAELK